MGASVQPQLFDPERERKAKLWAAAVKSGMSPDEATAFANQEVAAPSGVSQAFPAPVHPSTPSRAEQFAAKLGTPGIAESFQTGVRSGASFGFDDEALGAIGGAITGGSGQELGDVLDARKAMTRKAHPIASLAGEIGGSVIVPLSAADRLVNALRAGRGGSTAARLTDARPVLSTAAAGAGAGAVGGGLAAVGEGTGPFRSRLPRAGFSAAIGGGIGGALPVVGGAQRALIRGGKELATASVPQSISRAEQELADDILVRGLARDRKSIQDVEGAAQRAQQFGQPEVLGDVGGRNTLGAYRAVESQPSEGADRLTDALTERRTGRADRTVALAEREIGAAPENAFARTDELVGKRREAAKPLYEKAYAAPDVESPVLSELMEVPEFREAYERGRRIAKIDRADIPALPKDGPVGALPVRGIDYMKRGLDAIIESRAGSASALSRTEAKMLRDRLEEALGAVDEIVPDYATARGEFASDSRAIEAFEDGQSILRQPSAFSATQVAKMSKAERDLYREGAMSAIRDEVRKVADEGDAVKRIFGTPEKRDRIRALFDNPDDFNRFKLQMEREARMAQTEAKTLYGSPTARITAEQGDVEGAGTAVQLSQGGMMGALGALLNRTVRAGQGLNEPVRNAMALRQVARLDDPDAARTLVEAILASQRRGSDRAVRRTVASGVTGQQVGSYLNQQR